MTMPPFRRCSRGSALVLAALLGAGALPALADDVSESDGSALQLGAVSVRGRASGPLLAQSVFSSVDILGGELLQTQPVDYSWELLGRAPGVQLTQFRQGTVGGRFSFRGFNGEGRINAVKLLIDGIPSNDNSGGMPFLDGIFPLDIDAIEVVRGTNDPRYGLHNIAGNVNVRTRLGGNEGRVLLSTGSFDTQELQISKGVERGGWTQNYFLGYREEGGYRDHAQARKLALSGKWFYGSDDGRWQAGVIARWYQNSALEPGYLSVEQAREQPRQSAAYSAADRGDRRTRQLSAHLDARQGSDLFWSAKAYVNAHDTQRWVRYSQASVQQERDVDETHRGVLGTLTWRPKVSWAHEFTLEGGMDAQWQDNAAQRYLTVERQRNSQFRDWRFDLDTRGAYLQAVVSLTEQLKIIPALRIDHVDGQFHDRITGRDASTYDYGNIRQPKISVIYALSPQASVYGNWGRSFQIGSGIDAYQTQARNIEPSLNDGWETGLKFRPTRWLDGRIAYWEQRASGEVATVLGVDGKPDPGGLGNVGRTLRKGVDLQLNASIADRLQAWLAYSHQQARIVAPDPSAPATLGKRLESVPDYLVSAGVEWQATPALRLSASAQGEGNYFLERTNTLPRTGQYVVLNVGASYRISPDLSVKLQVKNLADRQYAYVGHDSGLTSAAPADGRAVVLGLDARC